jgi:hypothetical protein
VSDTTPEPPAEPSTAEPSTVEPTPAEPVSADPAFIEPARIDSAPIESIPAESVATDSAQAAEPVVLVEPAEQSLAPESDVAHAVQDSRPVAGPQAAEVAAQTPATVPTGSEPAPLPSAPRQTVYVHAPTAPQKKGNRGIGSLIALVSAVVFAALYAGIVLVAAPVFAPPRAVGFEFLSFITSSVFFVPVLVFAAAFILLVLLLNRAGWWAYILGSLFVGLFVYFASIGILLVLSGSIGSTANEGFTLFRSALQSPVTIIAGLVAREVALWMGASIAVRGRKVKARNAEAIAVYDRDSARARADYERAVAANASQ